MTRKTEEQQDAIPLFDEEKSKKVIEKKPRKKLKAKVWLLVKGWTRSNEIFALHEIKEEDLMKFNSLIKAIKSYKAKDSNWDKDIANVYDKYPKIKPKVIDEFEAYLPTGIDLCYTDESKTVIQPGCTDSIDSITVIRGTEEDII